MTIAVVKLSPSRFYSDNIFLNFSPGTLSFCEQRWAKSSRAYHAGLKFKAYQLGSRMIHCREKRIIFEI
jgi:hypothetical protein